MANTISSIIASRRAIFGAALTAPALVAISGSVAAAMPVMRSDFDAALSTYHRARDADLHDLNHGALKSASDLYDCRTAPFAAKFGATRNLAHGQDAVRWDAYFEEMQAAEQRHTEMFSKPRWAAFEALIAVPAPTIGALLTKIKVAGNEVDGDDIVEFVRADLARFAAQEG
ncbi:hypothetical protein ACFOKI_15825 [Sphingomonas qilianensis]|uniref:Uncharacterized protein n=1 Tax=Sphingomonas qilianensis TaxID=1736690 RepID=A0ABU9XWG2_9SPHN